MIDGLSRDIMLGVAFFDEPTAALGGWCTYGDMIPVRFSAPQELPQSIIMDGQRQSIIWLVNAEWGIYMDALRGAGYLRRQSFFGDALVKIGIELGLDMINGDRRAIVSTLAKIVSRAWLFALKAWPGIIPQETMGESILAHLNIRDVTDVALLEPLLESSFQETSLVAGLKYEADSQKVRLIPSRVRYATELLGYDIPSGSWSVLRGVNSVDKALNLDAPAFIECDITWKGAEYANLCAYGSIAYGRNISLRQWVALPELLFLAEHATGIKVSSAAVWDQFTPAPQLPDVFYEDSLTALSYSAGIVANSFMKAMAGKRYSKKHRKSIHPVRAAWLRSVDRLLSFSVAKTLADEGVRVSDYSNGEVTVWAFRHEMELISQAAAECGFVLVTDPWRGK